MRRSPAKTAKPIEMPLAEIRMDQSNHTHILIRVRIGATWRIRSIDLRSDGDAGCRYVTVAIPNGAFFYRDAAHFGKLTCCYCAVPEPSARVKYGKIK